MPDGETFSGNWLTLTPQRKIEGEIAFYTGMTGYERVLADPFYREKIVVFTYPIVGSYGITKKDYMEKKPLVSGIVVYETPGEKYHYKADYTLHEYLQKWDIPLLTHIDTRAVMKKIRSYNSLTAVLAAAETVHEPAFAEVEKTESVLSPFSKGKTAVNEKHGSAVAYA